MGITHVAAARVLSRFVLSSTRTRGWRSALPGEVVKTNTVAGVTLNDPLLIELTIAGSVG
jgi:hypothetical protein